MHRLNFLLLAMFWAPFGCWAGDQLLCNDTGSVDQLPRTAKNATDENVRLVSTPAKGPWIIDTHTHFKGTAQVELEAKKTQWRPENTLGRVVRPEDYRGVADRNDIQSTLVVEAVDQDQPQFNDWLLDQASSNLICGYVARGDLADERFLENYNRYRKSGYLNGYRFRREELRGYLDNQIALRHLETLENDSMVVDLLVDERFSKDVIELAKRFPRLKIVINHCFGAKAKMGGDGQEGQLPDSWTKAVRDTAEYPNVFCKISSILNFAGLPPFEKPAPVDSPIFQKVLQTCFDHFGEDRVIFGTNWGVCTHYGDVDDVVQIVSEFLSSQSESALQKGMRDNAIRVYGIPAAHLR